MTPQTYTFLKGLYRIAKNLSPVCSRYRQAQNEINVLIHTFPDVVAMLEKESEPPVFEVVVPEEGSGDKDGQQVSE